MILNYKREQEQMKREAQVNEKQYELELIRQNKLREEQKEQNYRDRFHKIHQDQTFNMVKLNQYMNKDTKDLERAQ